MNVADELVDRLREAMLPLADNPAVSPEVFENVLAAHLAVGQFMADRLDVLEEALAYYADPMTYFGIAMFGDPPHGDFFDDFEKYPFPGDYSIQDKPGRRARAALLGVRRCACPAGSYNPPYVHEPGCPLAEDGA